MFQALCFFTLLDLLHPFDVPSKLGRMPVVSFCGSYISEGNSSNGGSALNHVCLDLQEGLSVTRHVVCKERKVLVS
jgi:hypothetical protein